jgi:hypothetical protein
MRPVGDALVGAPPPSRSFVRFFLLWFRMTRAQVRRENEAPCQGDGTKARKHCAPGDIMVFMPPAIKKGNAQ